MRTPLTFVHPALPVLALFACCADEVAVVSTAGDTGHNSYAVCGEDSAAVLDSIPDELACFVDTAMPDWRFPALGAFASFDSCIPISPFVKTNRHMPPYCISVDFNRDSLCDYVVQLYRQYAISSPFGDSAIEGKLVVLQGGSMD